MAYAVVPSCAVWTETPSTLFGAPLVPLAFWAKASAALGFVVSTTAAPCEFCPRVVKKTPAFSPSQGAMSCW